MVPSVPASPTSRSPPGSLPSIARRWRKRSAYRPSHWPLVSPGGAPSPEAASLAEVSPVCCDDEEQPSACEQHTGDDRSGDAKLEHRDLGCDEPKAGDQQEKEPDLGKTQACVGREPNHHRRDRAIATIVSSRPRNKATIRESPFSRLAPTRPRIVCEVVNGFKVRAVPAVPTGVRAARTNLARWPDPSHLRRDAAASAATPPGRPSGGQTNASCCGARRWLERVLGVGRAARQWPAAVGAGRGDQPHTVS
jgi:hypothetical protein